MAAMMASFDGFSRLRVMQAKNASCASRFVLALMMSAAQQATQRR
jgi:hypothetical protein